MLPSVACASTWPCAAAISRTPFDRIFRTSDIDIVPPRRTAFSPGDTTQSGAKRKHSKTAPNQANRRHRRRRHSAALSSHVGGDGECEVNAVDDEEEAAQRTRDDELRGHADGEKEEEAWVVSDIGGRGGGSLEPGTQWQWLGAQWRGLLLEVPSCPEPPASEHDVDGLGEALGRDRKVLARDEGLEEEGEAEAEEDVEDVGAEGVGHGHHAVALLGDDERGDGVRSRGADGAHGEPHERLADAEHAARLLRPRDHEEHEHAEPHDRGEHRERVVGAPLVHGAVGHREVEEEGKGEARHIVEPRAGRGRPLEERVLAVLGHHRGGRGVGHVLALRRAEVGRVRVVQRTRVAEPLHVECLEGVEGHLLPVAARVLEHAHDHVPVDEAGALLGAKQLLEGRVHLGLREPAGARDVEAIEDRVHLLQLLGLEHQLLLLPQPVAVPVDVDGRELLKGDLVVLVAVEHRPEVGDELAVSVHAEVGQHRADVSRTSKALRSVARSCVVACAMSVAIREALLSPKYGATMARRASLKST
eukprot:scaffold42662_cov65-Phaeocystis_antarctica.AAC.2